MEESWEGHLPDSVFSWVDGQQTKLGSAREIKRALSGFLRVDLHLFKLVFQLLIVINTIVLFLHNTMTIL